MNNEILEKLRNTEEKYFYFYLEELKNFGLIKDISYEKDEFLLSTKVLYSKEVIKKTKNVVKESTLLQPHVYTIDFSFKIEPNHYILKKIFKIISEDTNKIYIDVKGKFARNLQTAVTFPLNQKWVFSKYNIYVEKKIPFDLFEKTFTPKRVIEEEVYKVNSKNNKYKKGSSKLKFEVKTIEQFLNENNYEKTSN
jgi:hypothetical protein